MTVLVVLGIWKRMGRQIYSGTTSECFANTHAPGPAVPGTGEVGTKIKVVLAAQFIPWPSAHCWQEVVDPEELTCAGEYFTDAPESGQTEPLRQR